MQARSGGRDPISVTVVTGFLGAGKTTLLNTLLRDPALAGTVVIVNEFGEIGLDHLFIDNARGEMILLASGCLCCSMRGDLIDTLEDLLERQDAGLIAPIARVLVETTGLADPAPILQVILAHPYISRRYEFDALTTVIDAVHGAQMLDAHQEAVNQAAMADQLVLAKTDIQPVSPDLLARLKRLNPGAAILDRAAGEASAVALIGAGFTAQSKNPDVGAWRAPDTQGRHGLVHIGDDQGHRHEASIRAFCLTRNGSIPASAFAMFLDLIRSAHGPKLLRVKGLTKIAEHPDRPLWVQGVRHGFAEPVLLERWPDGDTRTRIVFIADGLDSRFIDGLWDAFTGAPAIDTPDAAALIDNPLAIRGG